MCGKRWVSDLNCSAQSGRNGFGMRNRTYRRCRSSRGDRRLSHTDNKEINNFMAAEGRRIPFNHMIYFGDGLTDIPSMKLLRSQGGFAIAIYTPEHEQQTIDLVKRNIINFACKADYSEGEALYNTVKAIFQHIKALDNYNALEINNINEANKMCLDK